MPLTAPLRTSSQKSSNMLIILDNGHGIDTPGKRCKDLEEWIFNRNVVKFITFLLKERYIDHHVLVEEERDVRLRERTERADQIAKGWKIQTGEDSLLISIHGNAFTRKVDGATIPDGRPHGIETFYYSNTSKGYATVFQDELIKELGWRDRGVKKADFWIIKKSSMPAVLTENGFYTNTKERELMLKPEIQERIALAHVKAIERILNGN